MISRLTTYLPDRCVTNEEIAAQFPDWPAEKILSKTGIRTRRIAAPGQTAADLAFEAADRLLAGEDRSSIDFLILCTQTPDYILPTTACLLQDRLGLQSRVGAFDFNLGCSGYVYGLAISQALITAGLAGRVLLITSDTYSRLVHEKDQSTRTIFGDGSAATLLDRASPNKLDAFIFGTDGSGAEQLMVKAGGARLPISARDADRCIAMNGPEVFNFTLGVVPPLVEAILGKANATLSDIDLFVFHQANAFMLEHLRRKLSIPADRFVIELEHCGNTVSSTIPIALQRAIESGRLVPGMRVLLAGFGVGLSWAGCILDWKGFST